MKTILFLLPKETKDLFLMSYGMGTQVEKVKPIHAGSVEILYPPQLNKIN